MRIGQPWTEIEDAMLILLAAQRLSSFKIGERLGRTASAVSTRCTTKRVRLAHNSWQKARPWQPGELDAFKALVASGMSRHTCGRKLKRCARYLAKQAELLGLTFKTKADRAPDWITHRDEAVRLWNAGVSGNDVAKKLGPPFTRSSVIAKMHRLGLKRAQDPISRRENARKGAIRMKQVLKLSHKPKPPRPPLRPLPPPTKKKDFVIRTMRNHCRFAPGTGPKNLPLPKDHETDTARVAHHDLSNSHCRWVVGDPREVICGELFCGHTRRRGLPYCE